MSHHDHFHPAAAGAKDRRRLLWCAGLTGFILVVEAVGGFMARSLALLSDSGHMMTDLLALLLALFALKVSCRPATDRKTYGYYRLEILSALLNGALLVLISLYLMVEAGRRILHPRPVETGLMLSVAVVGLLANLVGIALLSPGRRNLNIRAALYHVLGDAFSSIGVIAGAVIMQATGWYRADPILSVVIAAVILVGAVRLVKEAVDVLLEGAPAGIDLGEVDRAIRSVEGVAGLHDLHIWCITTNMPALSGHVVVRDTHLPGTDALLNRIKRLLDERFGLCHTTLQLESERYQELGEIHLPGCETPGAPPFPGSARTHK